MQNKPTVAGRTYGRTDGRLAGQTDTMKLTVAFRSFATRLKSDFTERYY